MIDSDILGCGSKALISEGYTRLFGEELRSLHSLPSDLTGKPDVAAPWLTSNILARHAARRADISPWCLSHSARQKEMINIMIC